VCYDLRFPELFRHLAKQGMDILCLPAAFKYYHSSSSSSSSSSMGIG
jgi:predicted amidohydrolase